MLEFLLILMSTSVCNVNTADDTGLSLLCFDKSSANESLVVKVNNNGGPGECSSDVYPSGLLPDHYVYEDVKDGNSFGDTTNGNILLLINNSRFASVKTKMPNNIERRRINFVPGPTTYPKPYLSTLSVSLCPGDFSSTATCVWPFASAQDPNFFISFDQTDNPDTYCILERGETYYLNFINSDAPYSSPPRCKNIADTSCTVFFSEGAMN